MPAPVTLRRCACGEILPHAAGPYCGTPSDNDGALPDLTIPTDYLTDLGGRDQ